MEKDPYGFEAKIITDSYNVFQGSRLTTFQLRYPRFIHSEFMTHRVFSRNASSSRAIPVAKMIRQVRDAPAMPVHWGKNQKGMQAREELTGFALTDAQESWKRAAKEAADFAEHMNSLDLHKQVANRILEPFQFISVIVTATEWDNFFLLRDHPDADPNIAYLARMMRIAYDASSPVELFPHSDDPLLRYHLPYITDADYKQGYAMQDLTKMSSARCARVSYLTHEGKDPTYEEDIELYERLSGAAPPHMSPLEHQAKAVKLVTEINGRSAHGNFSNGWLQFRKFVEVKMPQEFFAL